MKEILMKNKFKIIKGTSVAVFIVTIIHVFLSMTYLFRGNQYSYDDRISVVGIKEEKEDSIDVIYIGGSAAFVYWEPLHAYKDCGFTSYALATNNIQAESILAYIKYAREYQNPALFIIDARPFQYYDDIGNEVGLRVTSDSLDIGFNRFNLINTYLNNRTLEIDNVALYLDIAKYHTNYDALKTDIAWQLMDNSMQCDYKGGRIQTAWSYLHEPQKVNNIERIELPENGKKTLIELLDYLKENNLNALFVVCPYLMTAEDCSRYNTVSDIVSEYGYIFLNTNDYYNEMGIDFSTDFYNVHHVNSLGAEKYTDFLENYLVQNYELPDHRSDDNYSIWQSLAEEYNIVSEQSRRTVQSLIDNANDAYEIGEEIKNTDSFIEWSTLVNDDRFTVISAGNCNFDASDIKPQFTNALSLLNLTDMFNSPNYIKIIRDGKVVAYNADGSFLIDAEIGHNQQTTLCKVDNFNSDAAIYINNINYSCSRNDGINMVVFDNYHRTIVDSIYLYVEDAAVMIGR